MQRPGEIRIQSPICLRGKTNPPGRNNILNDIKILLIELETKVLEGIKHTTKGNIKGLTLTATTCPFSTALCTCAMLPLAIGFLSNQSNTYPTNDRDTAPVLDQSISTNIKALSPYARGIEVFSKNPLEALTSVIGRPP